MTQQHSTKANIGIILIGILFFVFGFITWANSQLIVYLKTACQLSNTESYFVTTAFFAAYFIMALPSSYILNKTGFKKGMVLGLIVMALGALMFVPAAYSRSYPFFLTALFVIGTGLALLQTASNPYVTILGPIESAARRMSIMGICNKLAGISAIYILGSLVLNNADTINTQIQSSTISIAEKETILSDLAQKVVTPYIVITVFLLLLALLVYLTLPEVKEEEDSEVANEGNIFSKEEQNKSIFHYPHLILGAIGIFFYVGAEVISYDTFSSYGTTLGYSINDAKNFASFTGYAMLLGYFVSIILIPKYISQRKALVWSSIISLVLILLSINITDEPGLITFSVTEKIVFNLPTHTSVWLFALLGFSQAAIWPAIWPLAIDNVGRFVKIGAALLIMGIVGGAVLPPLYGVLADWMQHSGRVENPLQMAYIILIPCYLYLLYYAVSGSKQNNLKK